MAVSMHERAIARQRRQLLVRVGLEALEGGLGSAELRLLVLLGAEGLVKPGLRARAIAQATAAVSELGAQPLRRRPQGGHVPAPRVDLQARVLEVTHGAQSVAQSGLPLADGRQHALLHL